MNGDRLRLARKQAGLSLDRLAEELGGIVTKQAIGKYERGEMTPKSSVLMALADALGVTISFLLSDGDSSLRKPEFRKLASTSAKDRARVEAVVLDHAERYLAAEELLGLDTAIWTSPFGDPILLRELGDAERLADELRDKWDLGEDPIQNLTELLEEHGLKVFVIDLPNKVSGLTCVAEREDGTHVPLIVVNRNHPIERRRLTLAHELGHRLVDPDSPVDVEKAMNVFAGALLVPRSHLLMKIGEGRQHVSVPEILNLKRLYRVSALALLMRFRQFDVLSDAQLKRAFMTYAKTWRTKEPRALECGADHPFETPRRFERLCYRALAENVIGVSRASELLQSPIHEIQAAMRGPNAHTGH